MAEGTLEKGWLLDPESRLQARIDEQSELICILKKRADALLVDTQAYQKRIEKIETTNADLRAQLNTEKTKSCMLGSRFDDLADNHEEMIKYKDYHKSSATELRTQNDLLRQQNESLFSPEIAIRDRQIEEWKLKNEHLFDQIQKLQICNKTLSEQNVKLEEINLTNSNTIRDLTEKCDTLTAQNSSLTSDHIQKLKKLEQNHTRNIFELEQENQRLLKLSLTRGKELASKDEKIIALEAEISEKLKQLNAIDEDWKDAKHRLTKDSTVKRLTRENDNFKSTMAEKERAFEAFKEHSNELLERERYLNKRLRNYSLYPSESNIETSES